MKTDSPYLYLDADVLNVQPRKTDNSSTIIISAAAGSGILLIIVFVGLLIKCKRRNLAGKLSASHDNPPGSVKPSQEFFLNDQVGY